MKLNHQHLFIALIGLYFVLALSSCQRVTKVKEKAALKAVLERQRTDRSTSFLLKLDDYSPMIIDKDSKRIKVLKTYKPYVKIEIHYEGAFYNQTKDTIYFLVTRESWIKKDAKLPDSLKKDSNIKNTFTVCYLGIKQHDTIIIQDKFNPTIFFNDKDSKKRIYTEKLRQRIFDEFVDYVIEKRELYYDKAYFNDSVKENDNRAVFKPLYNLIEEKHN